MNNSNYQSRYVNEKEKLMNAWLNPNKSQNESKFKYNHNAILNPVPFVNQNPYIQKELNSLLNYKNWNYNNYIIYMINTGKANKNEDIFHLYDLLKNL